MILRVTAVLDMPHTIRWERDGNAIPEQTSETLLFESGSVWDTGSYTAVVSGAHGTVRSRSTDVVFIPDLPVVFTKPQGSKVSLGEPIRLNVEALGSGELQYQWRRNGVDIQHTANGSLEIPIATAEAYGVYDVIVFNHLGSAISSPVSVDLEGEVLVVDNEAAIFDGPWEARRHHSAVGGGYLFIATGAGLHSVRFPISLPQPGRWRVESHRVLGSESRIEGYHLVFDGDLMIDEISQINRWEPNFWGRLGIYEFGQNLDITVRITDQIRFDFGPGVTADAIRFVFVPRPPRIERHPVGTSIRPGADLELSVLASGAGPLEYQWQLNEMNLNGAIDSSLIIANVDSGDAGRYRVLVSNSHGGVPSQLAIIEVVAPPELGLNRTTGQLIWVGDYELQSAPSVAGPFTSIPNAQSPYPIQFEAFDAQFFRLQNSK